MTKRQLEKVRKRFEEADLSRYHILTYDEMLKVNGGSGSDLDDDEDEPSDDGDTPDAGETGAGNASEAPYDDEPGESGKGADAEDDVSGGHEVENSHEAVANAEPGDTITRDDGTEVTLTEADIEYEQNYCDAHGIDWQGEEKAPDAPESPEENLTEEELDDDSGSDCDTNSPEDKSENRQTEATDSSASKDRIEGEEEKSAGEGKNSSKGDEKESSVGSTKSEQHSSEKSGQVASGSSKANEKETGSNSKKGNSDYPDYVERCQRRDEDLAAKKNSELNNGSKNNGLKETVSSWFHKDSGEKLTEKEANIQKTVGILEMLFGTTAMVVAAEQTGGKSVQVGIFIDADGAYMFSQAQAGVKAEPFELYTNLINPSVGNIGNTPLALPDSSSFPFIK